MIKGVFYYAHRLAWLYVHGRLPTQFIDHINHNPSDNRIENLRDIPKIENHRNMAKSRANTSGHPGVIYNKQNSKWTAQLTFNKKHVVLGHYEDIQEAAMARKKGDSRFGFHENHGAPRSTDGLVLTTTDHQAFAKYCGDSND